MKNKYFLIAIAAAGMLSLNSCGDFLDRDPDSILTQEIVYSDPGLVKSVLANFYRP